MLRARDRFRAVPADYDRSRPLIGVVGEIFCRQNTFSNIDLIRVVEEHGGECWLSRHRRVGLVHRRRAAPPARREDGKLLGKDNAVRFIKSKVSAATSTRSTGRSTTTSSGYEEPHDVREVLELS